MLNKPWRQTFAQYQNENSLHYTQNTFSLLKNALDLVCNENNLVTGQDIYNIGATQLRKCRNVGKLCVAIYNDYCDWLSANTISKIQHTDNTISVFFFVPDKEMSVEYWDALQVPRNGDFVQLLVDDKLDEWRVVKVVWQDQGRSAEIHVFKD